MKGKLLVASIFVVFLSALANAQQSVDATINRLKTEIARRELVDREPSTPDEQRLSNRANLERARTALLEAVQTKIAALEKYLDTLGESVTVEERNGARAAVRRLSADANATVERAAPTAPPEASAGATPAVATGSAPVETSNSATPIEPLNAPATTVPTPAADDNKTAYTRAIIGLEQAAAASAKSEQKLFLEFNLTAPLFRSGKPPLRAPLWLWLNPRITSLPKQISSSVAEFSTASNFVAPFTSAKVNDVVQGFEFLGGIEVPLRLHGSPVTGELPSGFGDETKVRFGVSFVVGAGMQTPFGTQQVGPQVFKVNDTVVDAFPGAKDKQFIAFVNPDRNRFFRQYYAGLRLKSYFVKTGKEELDKIFPGVIDLTFGQNETVTGGSLHGGVVRIDGIYPLPFVPEKYKGSLFAFGSALMKLSKPKLNSPVILQPPDATVQVPGKDVFIQQVPPRDADHYRIGIGVDLIRLFKGNN